MHSCAGMHPSSRAEGRGSDKEAQGKGAKSRRAQSALSGHGQGKDDTNTCLHLVVFPGRAVPVGQEKVLCNRQAGDTGTLLAGSSGRFLEEQGAGANEAEWVRLGNRQNEFSRVMPLRLELQTRSGG